MTRTFFTVVLVCALAFVGCGGDASTDSASSPRTRSTPATTAAAEPVKTTRREEPDVEAAEDAARDELPDTPIWEGTRFEGTVVGDSKVCVDRVLTKAAAQTIGGARTSHVVVTWPELDVGEPQDGPCAKAAQNADRAVTRARQFYLRMDDDAIALDKAVSDAQDGAAGAVARIKALRTRIRDRLNAYLLDGGDTSVGANLLLSAATTAREAAQAGDVAELADQRREIADARTKLAEELAR